MHKIGEFLMLSKLTSVVCAGLILVAPSVVLADPPDKPEDFLRKAVSALNQKNYRGAEYQLREAVSLTKTNPDVWNLLGFSYRQQGKLEKAWDAYERALTLDPNHVDANEYLGELYLMQGQVDLAKQQLAKLDQLCPSGCKERDVLAKAIADHTGS